MKFQVSHTRFVLCMCNFLKYTLWTIYFSRRSFKISVIQSAEEKALNFTEFSVWKIAVLDLLRPFSNLLSCEKDWVSAAFLPYFTYKEEVKEAAHFQRAVSCGKRSVSRWRRVAFEIPVLQAQKSRMCISCRAVVLERGGARLLVRPSEHVWLLSVFRLVNYIKLVSVQHQAIVVAGD